MNYKMLNRICAVSLMIVGVFLLIIGIAGTEIPHTLRLIIAGIQIIVGMLLFVTTVFKFKK